MVFVGTGHHILYMGGVEEGFHFIKALCLPERCCFVTNDCDASDGMFPEVQISSSHIWGSCTSTEMHLYQEYHQ